MQSLPKTEIVFFEALWKQMAPIRWNGPNANSVSNDLWLDLLIRAQSVVFLYRSETPKIFISHLSHLLAIKQY